jgi:O-antigen/teichoic acid export membrane protein
MACPALFGVGVIWEGSWAMGLAAIALGLGVSGQVFGRGVHLGTGLLLREFVAQTGAGLLGLTLLGACYLFFPGVLTASGTSWLLAAGLLAYTIATWPVVPCRSSDRALRREIDRFVVLTSLGSLASAGVAQWLVLVGNARLSPASAGYLAFAVSISLPLGLISAAVSMSLYPRFSAMAGQGAQHEGAALRKTVFRILGITFVPAVLLGLYVLPSIISTIMGAEYAAAAAPAQLLIAGVSLQTVSATNAAFLTSRANRWAAGAACSAWAGACAAMVAWFAVSPTPVALAGGYALGVVITGTGLVMLADAGSSERLAVDWLLNAIAVVATATAVTGLAGDLDVALAIAAASCVLANVYRGRDVLARSLRATRHP